MTVSAMTNPAPGSTTPHGQLVELVSGTWLAEDVFGRQVLLNFVPPSGAIGFLDDPANQSVRIRCFVYKANWLPSPRLRSLRRAPRRPPRRSHQQRRPRQAMPPKCSTGSPITLQGDVLSQPSGSSDDTTVPVGDERADDGAVGKPAQECDRFDHDDAGDGARRQPFPEVELDVAVLDSAGNSVDGLDAASFTITDNGTAAPSIALMSNTVSDNKPRVLVIYDTTGSVRGDVAIPRSQSVI